MAGIWGDGQRGGIFGAKVDPRQRVPLKVYLNAGERDRVMGDQAPLPFSNRIAGAFDASAGMQEPSHALYAAKHRRAQGLPPETSFLEDVASLGPRAWGGAQKMWQAAPMAAEALYNDPLGSINRVGMVGQAATDAMVRGMVKPFTQFGDPNVDPVKQAADLAMTVMGGSSVVPAEANSLRMGIKAYHGSPHDFERFDSSKIGTGEGAQAYGHGLYFGEREAVAEEYKKSLAQTVTVDGKPLLQNNKIVGTTGRKSVDDELVAHNGDLEAAISNLEVHVSTLTPGQAARGAADDLAALKALRGRVSTANTGHMYQVDIAADPEHFLDWDKPLSEQSPKVREAMERAGYTPSQGLPPQYSTVGYTAGRELRKPAETALLREQGIPGIKYLDQGSRGQMMFDVGSPRADFGPYTPFRNRADAEKHLALLKRMGETDAEIKEIGKQTSNYVVFDDKLISILKKYGLPISAAGLATLSQLHPQEAQAAQARGN